MKIKLTKEQYLETLKDLAVPYQNSLRGNVYPILEDVLPDSIEIGISESQIITEESNVEKWYEVLTYKLTWDLGPSNVASLLDSLGFNADAAYKEVCGDE